MKFEVQMWFSKKDKAVLQKRTVEIPACDIREFNQGNAKNKLSLIMYYGQNHIQPCECPSVSMGDVINLDGELYLVKADGFHLLTEQQYKDYTSLSQQDRLLFSLVSPNE